MIRNDAKQPQGLFTRMAAKVAAFRILQYFKSLNHKPLGQVKCAFIHSTNELFVLFSRKKRPKRQKEEVEGLLVYKKVVLLHADYYQAGPQSLLF